MTEDSGRVERSTCGISHGASPLQQRSVQSFVLAASIFACGYIAWNYPPRHDTPQPMQVGVEVDLNAATERELSLVSGIGPTLAKRIVENRQRLGDFPTIESLQRVHGIGPKTVERVATICVVEDEIPRVASK